MKEKEGKEKAISRWLLLLLLHGGGEAAYNTYCLPLQYLIIILSIYVYAHYTS